jgi:uncharacterized protein (DUF2235 family)
MMIVLDTLAGAEGTMAKVIAVFADGTGNSAAKLFKTNVWRLYDALDTSEPDKPTDMRQIAYYHDGVGTSSFKPLAVVGGAFGWGLKRNILDLYTFICRNYEKGDHICAFGFSRGAFTVRLLAGLVAEQGLIRNTSEEDLKTYSRDAYRQFRRKFKQTGGLVEVLRDLRDFFVTRWRRLSHKKTYDEQQQAHRNHMPDVDFLGVWDTVAAYGMPIAEITRGIDDWIWPLSMPNYRLHEKVKRARHALALDDERDTFHPLIWDEQREHGDRIQQVWFAGMHSDVGGGYPDDSLAYVSLDWMMVEAWTPDPRTGFKLRFQQKAVDEIKRIMSANGALHDSRRGVGASYRYQPRKLSARINPPDPTTLLMQDPDSDTRPCLKSVQIHDSVFRRMQDGTDRYAPIVLPGSYSVVSTAGSKLRAPAVEAKPLDRAKEQERVWDRVWQRRVTYFITMGVSAYLLLFPLWNVFWPPTACVGPQCLLSSAIYAVGGLVPAVGQPWINALAAAPGRSVAALIVVAFLLAFSRSLQTQTRDDMRALWDTSLNLGQKTVPPRGPRAWIRPLRSSHAYQRFFQWLKWSALPVVFGVTLLIASFALGIALVGMGVIRAGIWVAEYKNAWCPPSGGSDISTSSECSALPDTVKAGKLYRISVTVKDRWVDRTIDTNPEGFGPATMGFVGNLLSPLRRSMSGQWFQPMVKIVPKNGMFAMVALQMQRADVAEPRYTAQFTAPKGGHVYFFVNDVKLPRWAPYADEFYLNNIGSATIALEEVKPQKVPAKVTATQ